MRVGIVVMSLLVCALTVLSVPSGTNAQAAPAADKKIAFKDKKQQAVRKCYDRYVELEVELDKEYKRLRLIRDKAEDVWTFSEAEGRMVDYEKSQKKKMKTVKAELLKCFEKVDYESWDLKASRDLVLFGLVEIVETQADNRYVHAKPALDKIKAFASDSVEFLKATLKVAREQAQDGEYEVAKKVFEEAKAALKKDIKASDPRYFAWVEFDLNMRKIGELAPEIKPDVAWGSKPKKLEEYRESKVVIMDFFSLQMLGFMCSLPEMELLATDSKTRKKVQVIGVTDNCKSAMLPEEMQAIRGLGMKGYEYKGGLDDAEWRKCVGKLHRTLQISYPFARLTANVEVVGGDDNAKKENKVRQKQSDYDTPIFPSTYIIDREGKIASIFLGVGTEGERIGAVVNVTERKVVKKD